MKFQSATNKMILSQIIIILIKFTLCPKSNFRGYTIVCFYTSPYFYFIFLIQWLSHHMTYSFLQSFPPFLYRV